MNNFKFQIANFKFSVLLLFYCSLLTARLLTAQSDGSQQNLLDKAGTFAIRMREL